MARKPTKTQLREQARQEWERQQRDKQYAIIKIENERGWGFVEFVIPVIGTYLVPHFVFTAENYSALAYAFERDTAEWWARRVEEEKGVKATVIPVEERWDSLRYSRNLIAMAQRYVA